MTIPALFVPHFEPGPERDEIATRFMVNQRGQLRFSVDPSSNCWIWKDAIANNGYGRIGFKRKMYQAHRFIYCVVRGTVPPGIDLDHLCRNRRCVNPWHLEPVTRAINARRGARSKLTQGQVDEIRRLWAAKGITQARLGAQFGVDASVISEIVNWKIWQ